LAIQDDITIDVVDKKITYDTAFVNDRPPSIYTVNQLYSYLQDTFDEPGFLQYEIPMSAQTPTQYTLINQWFIDDETMKALYGGSIQTSSWTKSGATGITGLRWASATAAPDATDIGKAVTGVSSGATGVILAVDTVRQIVWVRNTSVTQFSASEVVDDDATGINPDFTLETNNGIETGESVWSNLFSVGSLQANTDIYVGQDDDYMGGAAFHDPDADSRFERRIEKLDEWWDADVDFTSSPNLLGGLGHFDILVKTQEAGNAIDGQRLAVFARQFSKVFSHFELTGGVGNFVVPFSSGASDLNAQDGPYTVAFDGRAGTDMAIGDIIENGLTSPSGRLRAVITSVSNGNAATGTIGFFLLGDTEPLATTDRTLIQLSNNDNLVTRGSSTNDFEVNGTPTATGPALANPGAGAVTITFADAQVDVNEDSTNEEYACTIDCANNTLASVYKRVMFLTARGNQDGTVADTQDTLLPSAHASKNEAGEFYRGVGDIIFNYDGGQGTQPTEGNLVTNGSGAYGTVTSITAGTTGVCVLTAVTGTFADNDVIAEINALALNNITINEPVTGVVSVVDNTAAPFGTFAGGRWFVAQGVVLINVPTADANNWETIDLTGAQIIPPTVRTITFAGLVANDRAALLEVDTAGGADVTKNQNGVGVAGASIGAATIPLDSTVALDVPTTGWVRVVDTSSTTGEEYRFAYSAVAATTVTLDQGAWSTGTTTGSESATVLTDIGAFTNFGAAGQPRIGMHITNTTLSEHAIVLRKINNDSIETSVLSGGGNWHSAGTADTWEMNAPVVALVDADTIYFPFIDDVATGTTISKNIKYVGDTNCIARARFSDPDVGGTRILPYVQKNITVADSDLTVTAIRTTDSIAG